MAATGERRHLGCDGRVGAVDTRRISSFRCLRCRAYISEIQTYRVEEARREKRRGPDSNR